MTTEERIIRAVRIAQKATFVVKVMPFAYAFLFMSCLIAYMFTSDEVQTILDTIFYISPITIIFTLILSKTCKLCKWHRLECVLPLLSQVTVMIDLFYPLTEVAAQINVATIIAIFLLSIINAYFTFWRNTPPRPN